MHSSPSPSFDYIAYIDEAGDDGLRVVKPLDKNGSSEWLILSAVVIRASHEQTLLVNSRKLVSELTRQARSIHFSKLPDQKKLYACQSVASESLRCFVVASNKKNMKGYRNKRAEKIPSSNWFYCWMTRILLERVTHFIANKSIDDFGEPRRIKLEFSQRGGLRYSQMSAYYDWLKIQGENTYLQGGYVDFSVLHRDLLKVYPHYVRAGLQYADVVASAFFKACDKHDTGACDPRFAMTLAPRMARFPDTTTGRVSGYGLKLRPSLKRASLDPDQAEIFTHFGYPTEWRDPGALSTRPF